MKTVNAIFFLAALFLTGIATANDCRESLQLPTKERVRLERFLVEPRFADESLEPVPVYSIGSPSEPDADYDHIARVDLHDAIAEKRLAPVFALDTNNGRKNDLYRKQATENYERIVGKIQRGDKVSKKDYENLVGLELTVEGKVCVIHSDLIEEEAQLTPTNPKFEISTKSQK